MTNALDLEFQPEVWAAVQEVGVPATFSTFPSISQDDAQSSVTEGADTPVIAKITPPSPNKEELAGSQGGSGVGEDQEKREMKTFLASGVGEAPIGFTPEIGQRVSYSSSTWIVIRVDPVIPGDNVIGWELILQE